MSKTLKSEHKERWI